MSTRNGERLLRIGINARLLNDPMIRGWNRYTINLLAELPAQGVELFLYSQKPVHPVYLERLPAGSYQARSCQGLRLPRWEHKWLPQQCKLDDIDILHSPFNFGLPWSCPCPMVLTLHDAIDFVYYRASQPLRQKLSGASLRFWLYHWIARKRASRIITVSQHARIDLIEFLKIPKRRINVVYEAADPSFRAPITETDRVRVRASHRLPPRYLFYVGGWEGRKNIPFLLDAFALAKVDDVSLVLAGGKPEQRSALMAQAQSLGIADRLHLLGWVEEADLPALLAEALAFVYPSAYEGFGLQLCESMAVGTPTLAARASCLPEILGEGGETFSLETPVELAALIRRVAIDPPFRSLLHQRAAKRSADFSWRLAAQQTMQIYRSLLKKRKRETRRSPDGGH